MKDTFKNLKTVYKYGKEHKRALIYETIGSAIGIIINIIIPIVSAKIIVNLTNNLWEELIYMSLVLLCLGILSAQKTEIILFDEATSALDNETQYQIQEAINNLKKNYTIMIIAHRFSTIVNCDKIFYIDKGKVIDEGTHEELIKRCKGYKELYEAEITD